MNPLGANAKPAAYTLVADQLRLAIQMGHYLPGQQFPAERELAEQLGVSRTTLREAARVLEGEGLVETRHGRTGGLRVLERRLPATEVRRLLRERKEYGNTVFDFRRAVECAAAQHAAKRRTKTELTGLRALLKQMDSLMEERFASQDVPHRWSAADTLFHVSVARAAHNPLIENAVIQCRAEMFHPINAVFTHIEPYMGDQHDELVDAIADRDPGRAEKVMADHIETTRAGVLHYIRTGRVFTP